MDFTLEIYDRLLTSLSLQGFTFNTFEEFVSDPSPHKVVVLRHDIDRLPGNALGMAQIEYRKGIRATYFFRTVKPVWNAEIVRQIVSLGHEVSYHYEDLSICRGDYAAAIRHFTENLAMLRAFYPSRTICMHGSPLSKWNNSRLWEKYNYKDYGIIAEPYFDVDYSSVFYITDTGRAWNNDKFNRRDTVVSGYKLRIRSTSHLISLIQEGALPEQLILTIHPHRWFDPGFGWARELVAQNLKNIVKRILIRLR